MRACSKRGEAAALTNELDKAKYTARRGILMIFFLYG